MTDPENKDVKSVLAEVTALLPGTVNDLPRLKALQTALLRFPDPDDSFSVLSDRLHQRINELFKDDIYLQAKREFARNEVNGWLEAKRLLAMIPNWSDSEFLVSDVEEKLRQYHKAERRKKMIIAGICLTLAAAFTLYMLIIVPRYYRGT